MVVLGFAIGLIIGALAAAAIFRSPRKREKELRAELEALAEQLRARDEALEDLRSSHGSLQEHTESSVALLKEVADLISRRQRTVEGIVAARRAFEAWVEECGIGSRGDDLLEILGRCEEALKSTSESDDSSVVDLSGVQKAVSQVAKWGEEFQKLLGELIRSSMRGKLGEMESVYRGIRREADEALELAGSTTAVAQQGYGTVHQTLDHVESLVEIVDQTRVGIVRLGKSIDDIGEVLRIIRDVADRTNLLALNASIIAAQAGEHGRAFRVVAEEIKSLAERTTESTGNIDERVRQIQADRERVIQQTFAATETTREGREVAAKAGDNLNSVQQSANLISRKIRKLVKSIEKQDRVSQDVVGLVSNLEKRASTASDLSSRHEEATKALQRKIVGLRETIDAGQAPPSMLNLRSEVEASLLRLGRVADKLRDESAGYLEVQTNLRTSIDRLTRMSTEADGLAHQINLMVSTVSVSNTRMNVPSHLTSGGGGLKVDEDMAG